MGIMFMISLHSLPPTLKYKGRLNNLRVWGEKKESTITFQTHFNDFFSTYNTSSEEEEKEDVPC